MSKVGAGIGGNTSVSYEGTTLGGDARERLETRVVLFPAAPAFPTQTLTGDFRGDFFGEAVVTPRLGEKTGCGVGGSSANIISTCQDRFSSNNRILSASRQTLVGDHCKFAIQNIHLEFYPFLPKFDSSFCKPLPLNIKIILDFV
jgi:hypothetical protein